MLDMSDIVSDADLGAPHPFTILRSTGQFIQGGFQSVTEAIEVEGVVLPASTNDIDMLPEADKVSQVVAFWCTHNIFVTSGHVPEPSNAGCIPAGALPGKAFTLSPYPPAGVQGVLTIDGLLVLPRLYAVSGGQLVTLDEVPAGSKLYYEWPVDVRSGQAASDILVYENEQYRVLSSNYYFGSGFYKALGTKMSAA